MLLDEPAARPRRRRLALVLALAAVAAAVAALVVALEVGGGCTATSGFGAGRWPPGCWRPYGDRYFMNRRVPAHPEIEPRSAAIVARMRSFGAPNDLEAYAPRARDLDYYHPFYFSRPSDPVFRVHAHEHWRCEIDGLRIRIPPQARPAQGSDHHLAVIDQAAGREYDLWHVQHARLAAGGGTVGVGCGGVVSFTAPTDPFGGATAGGWGLLAGVIRSDELAAGRIDHALLATVACSSGRAVPPAEGASTGRACPGDARADAPAIGQWLWLDMSDADIDALDAPPWRKAILRALHRYGAYVGDTGGGAGNALGFELESDETYRSFGYPGHAADLGDRLAGDAGSGVTLRGGVYRFDMASGFPWDRLRVLAPPKRPPEAPVRARRAPR